ncbi:MAG: DNA/RNA nuclease SfsA, partial [Dehalococcoidales bacterium]|nr:DNA/RNA nuclease SfsA [Dehalococcoidales bacterium]
MRIVNDRLEQADFLRRPNRFVVECELSGRHVSAYLPNPGRLWELLVPGCTLYVKRNPPSVKMTHTVMAVEKEGIPVLLHTHMTNDVAEILLRRKLIPGWEDAEIIRREVAFGESRFDFSLRRDGREMVLEVKSCTLSRNRLAMFPDAVTTRGSRHLLGLNNLSREGLQTGVLFI